MRVLVTGGCGYIGSRLVPALLAANHEVTVLDALIFGPSPLPAHPRLRLIEGDIRDTSLVQTAMRGQEQVIHLAFLSNDPDFRLDPAIAREVNLNGFEHTLEVALSEGVRRWIQASSCSVYGAVANGETFVNEAQPPMPLTDYARHKAACDHRLIQAKRPGFAPVSLRAATVCGYAPRQRMDLTFNRFAIEGYLKRHIVVERGQRYRPYLSLSDLVALYLLLLEAPEEAISGAIFNAAHGNHTLAESAQILAAHLGPDVVVQTSTTASVDDRSYRVSSSLVERRLGFRPRESLTDAADGLIAAVNQGLLVQPETNPAYDNRTMQQRYDWSRIPFSRQESRHGGTA
ncbi:MAG: NAD(P)-dependent oxidoreductase [Magnetococcales bacterium]|nr:NAD(P)-dependent oxidoreductase [Magnetococcales bacterium]